MRTPPMTGPSAIGIRRTRECMVTPMVRLFSGRTPETRLIVAGSETADQDIKNRDPIITACQ